MLETDSPPAHRTRRLRALPLLALFAGAALAAPRALAADAGEPAAKAEDPALDDDILGVLDLPLTAQSAREAGVPEDEVEEIVASGSEAGLGAAETAKIVAAEAEVAREKKRGHRGIGAWVKLKLAEGLRGEELAKAIRDMKAELKEMTAEEKAKLKADTRQALAKLRAERGRLRKELHAKRRELVAAGKAVRLTWKEEHRKLVADAKLRIAKRKKHRRARRDVAAAAQDLRGGNTPEEKAEARHDLREAKQDLREAKQEHREARREMKGDRKEAAKNLRDAKRDRREAKREAKQARHELKKSRGRGHAKGADDAQ